MPGIALGGPGDTGTRILPLGHRWGQNHPAGAKVRAALALEVR